MIKAKAHRLNKPEDGNFGKIWNYICDQHEIKECFTEGFFSTMGGNLMAGDTVRMIEIRKNRIISLCEGIVLEVTKNTTGYKVEFHPLSEKIKRFPLGEGVKEKPSTEPAPVFISGTGLVEWNLGKRTYVITADGKPVCEIDNKAEAHAVARGDKPLPVMA
jgi:hypothetical protein|tara:strand:- start:43 stop:525 length:483 start_codon:yes stop_codon:yes gene_type:complete